MCACAEFIFLNFRYALEPHFDIAKVAILSDFVLQPPRCNAQLRFEVGILQPENETVISTGHSDIV